MNHQIIINWSLIPRTSQLMSTETQSDMIAADSPTERKENKL
ncbi:Uncharacterised protein [Yersinia wautersii]|uniref:Uncharacterized protein n=1 Tax=Yersinia wautersii TaxID=1341643 RepID=A0ABM9TEB0_9GAMM|nr:Uncharacterised protein [Yersinia wautersii]